jgi:hypothetical protein
VYEQIDIFSDLIALQLGIIHPKIAEASKSDHPGSIDEALASMSEREARACRRKFRKILRKRSRRKSSSLWSSRRKRTEVMIEIRGMAWAMVDGHGVQDNDE